MSLDEVIEENPTVSQHEAIREIKLHAASVAEFFAEVGNKQEYKALDVLYFLGY